MKLIKVEKVDEEFLKEVVKRIVSAVDLKRLYFLAPMPMENQRKGAIWICWLW